MEDRGGDLCTGGSAFFRSLCRRSLASREPSSTCAHIAHEILFALANVTVPAATRRHARPARTSNTATRARAPVLLMQAAGIRALSQRVLQFFSSRRHTYIPSHRTVKRTDKNSNVLQMCYTRNVILQTGSDTSMILEIWVRNR